jgi:amino-acid N-acetyltransferase
MLRPMPSSLPVIVRPARLTDVPALHALIGTFAEQKLMLPRPMAELYENVRDFLVAEAEPGGLAGCTAVHIDTSTIGELKALAVAQSAQGRGVGRALVQHGLLAARELGLQRLFCLTYQVDFFDKMGFTKVDRSRLPDKVWSECVRCHRFLDCDEVAMWRSTGGIPGVPETQAAT